MHSLTWPEVWQRRLAHHCLMRPGSSIAEVARAACGIHAQVQASAELAIGLRLEDTTQQDVRAALWEHKTLVRAHGLRGTVHLYAADDLALWLAAFRAKAPARPRNKYEEGALPSERVQEVVDAIGDALDGKCLTRDELNAALERRLGDWVVRKVYPGFLTQLPPWYVALAPAAAAGVLAFGPSRGTQVRYVRPNQWLDRPLDDIDGQVALRQVLRRFLHAYGPATSADFARWFSTSPNFARGLFADARADLEEVDVEGWRAWQLAGASNAPHDNGPGVHLLPYFDVYVVGGYPRQQLIPEHAPEVVRKNGTAAGFAVLLVDGVVGGLWRRDKVGRRLAIRVDPCVALGSAQRDAIEAQALRVGEILETPVDFRFDTVEPKGHW